MTHVCDPATFAITGKDFAFCAGLYKATVGGGHGVAGVGHDLIYEFTIRVYSA